MMYLIALLNASFCAWNIQLYTQSRHHLYSLISAAISATAAIFSAVMAATR